MRPRLSPGAWLRTRHGSAHRPSKRRRGRFGRVAPGRPLRLCVPHPECQRAPECWAPCRGVPGGHCPRRHDEPSSAVGAPVRGGSRETTSVRAVFTASDGGWLHEPPHYSFRSPDTTRRWCTRRRTGDVHGNVISAHTVSTMIASTNKYQGQFPNKSSTDAAFGFRLR